MKRNWKTFGVVAIALAIIIGLTAILLNLLHGNTTTTASETQSVKYDYLHCDSNNISYPIFTYDESSSKKLNIDLTFDDKGLKTITLDYTLYYNDETKIVGSEAHNHAAMNISFGKDGLNADEFNAKYTKLKDGLRMNLYTKGTEISSKTAKYFLIDTSNGGMPTNLSEYKLNYEKQGLVCQTKK